MGEIAEMMLDGTLCEECGVYIEGDPPGYPRKCRDCSGREKPTGVKRRKKKRKRKKEQL